MIGLSRLRRDVGRAHLLLDEACGAVVFRSLHGACTCTHAFPRCGPCPVCVLCECACVRACACICACFFFFSFLQGLGSSGFRVCCRGIGWRWCQVSNLRFSQSSIIPGALLEQVLREIDRTHWSPSGAIGAAILRSSCIRNYLPSLRISCVCVFLMGLVFCFLVISSSGASPCTVLFYHSILFWFHASSGRSGGV